MSFAATVVGRNPTVTVEFAMFVRLSLWFVPESNAVARLKVNAGV